MSNTNHLRRDLQDTQVWNATFGLAGLPKAGDTPVYPRHSAFKSTSDRTHLAFQQVTGDLWRQQNEVGSVGTRSSEAGIREREAGAQVQTSRTFSSDLLTEQDLREDAGSEYGLGSTGDDLAWEVAQQERDFGPEVEQQEKDEQVDDCSRSYGPHHKHNDRCGG